MNSPASRLKKRKTSFATSPSFSDINNSLNEVAQDQSPTKKNRIEERPLRLDLVHVPAGLNLTGVPSRQHLEKIQQNGIPVPTPTQSLFSSDPLPISFAAAFPSRQLNHSESEDQVVETQLVPSPRQDAFSVLQPVEQATVQLTDNVPTCSLCKKQQSSTNDAFLTCAVCSRSWHPLRCLQIPPEMAKECRLYAWECGTCRKCQQCFLGKKDDTRALYSCRLCQRPWHAGCVAPPIKSDSDRFACPVCVSNGISRPKYFPKSRHDRLTKPKAPRPGQVDGTENGIVRRVPRPSVESTRPVRHTQASPRLRYDFAGLDTEEDEMDLFRMPNEGSSTRPFMPGPRLGREHAALMYDNTDSSLPSRGLVLGKRPIRRSEPAWDPEPGPAAPPAVHKPRKYKKRKIIDPASRALQQEYAFFESRINRPPPLFQQQQQQQAVTDEDDEDDEDDEEEESEYEPDFCRILNPEEAECEDRTPLYADRNRFQIAAARSDAFLAEGIRKSERFKPFVPAKEPKSVKSRLAVAQGAAPLEASTPSSSTFGTMFSPSMLKEELLGLERLRTRAPAIKATASFMHDLESASQPGTPSTAPMLPDGAFSNISKVAFGDKTMNIWFQAPYSEDVSRVPYGILHLCEWCLKFFRTVGQLETHIAKCQMRSPPGDEIYQDGNISVWEIDGRKSKIYCQNLCLLSKMFLDHKTLYYDVDSFHFYVLTERDSQGARFMGYFSKEKRSPTNNLSCITTLPIRQQGGLGQFLVDFSYLLSRQEGRVGTPEEPLSDLGMILYHNYWKLQVYRFLLSHTAADHTIEKMSAATGMRLNDVLWILTDLHLIVDVEEADEVELNAWKRRLHMHAMHILARPSVADLDRPLPQRYRIEFDRSALEEHVARIDAKGTIKIKPDLLKWTPFVLPIGPTAKPVMPTPPRGRHIQPDDDDEEQEEDELAPEPQYDDAQLLLGMSSPTRVEKIPDSVAGTSSELDADGDSDNEDG